MKLLQIAITVSSHNYYDRSLASLVIRESTNINNTEVMPIKTNTV